MNNLVIKFITHHKRLILPPIKLLVFDMAGTTVNEGGIVYKTLYNTIKDCDLDIKEDEISNWYGANKYEVLDHFLMKSNIVSSSQNKDKMRSELYNKFDTNLKHNYFSDNKLKLINDEIPPLFNKIREKDIKIALNTGYNKDIQEAIINKLDMKAFIDDYISSEEVSKGRPYPYMIYKLMERNKINSSSHVVKIGDSVNDILEGKNANCKATIGVLSGANNSKDLSIANYIVNNVMDIDID